MLSALIPVIVMQIGLLLGFSTFMLAVVLVHEAGHVMAGLLCGFRIISVKVGPVQFLLPHSWQFTFRRKRFLDGSVQVQFRKMPGQWARWQCFGFLFGGSLTNICAALLVLPFAIRDTAMADIFAFFILASVFLAVTQLIPFEVRGIRSDGAKLIALLFSRTKRDAFLFNLSLNARIQEIKTLFESGQFQEALNKTEKMASLCESNPLLRVNAQMMECHSKLRELLQKHLSDTAAVSHTS